MGFLKQAAKKYIPHPILSKIKRYTLYSIPDFIALITGRSEEFVPPKRMIFIGGTEYKKIGDEFFQYFLELGRIRPNFEILDVGCGIGRMARPLIKFLSKNGKYEGFDIDKHGVDWCKSSISIKYDNFQFQVADVYNKYYNPGGKSVGSTYKFPYEDQKFNFVFSTSVFTHMFLPDIENYINEIARVSKPSAICFLTFFLWNAEAESLSASGKSSIALKKYGDCWIQNEAVPEQAISHSESKILEILSRSKLNVQLPIRYGNWCGRQEHLSYQDIILVSK